LTARVLRSVFVVALVCCCLGSSAAWAIDCLSSPGDPKTGYYSWRQIDGRKCWFRKTGATPPKSQLHWPAKTEQANRSEAAVSRSEPEPQSPAQDRTGSIPAAAPVKNAAQSAPTSTPPRFKMVRVRPSVHATVRLGHGFDLMSGTSLSARQPLGARREPAGDAAADSFSARFTGRAD
jgi:hypothetical protein